jgi:uracil phosphoribosyltransferase
VSSNITLLEHPLAAVKLSILRLKTTAADEFRRNLEELATLLVCEASRAWTTAKIAIETPLKETEGAVLSAPVILVPILRAGLGMLPGALRLLPDASTGHIGIYRNEETLQPVTYFCRLPGNVADSQVLLIDPMLATGNSAVEAATLLKAQGAKRIQMICAVACPQGIDRLVSAHRDVHVFTAAIDPELNKFGFIVPGLGDAGDRCFGTD